MLLPLRLQPGVDLRAALQQVRAERDWPAVFVVAGIGSFSRVCLRFAGVPDGLTRDGNFELLSLSGTLSPDGAHLHASVADADGRVSGGHLLAGCLVRTTAEILLQRVDGWSFHRERDPATGYAELLIRRA